MKNRAVVFASAVLGALLVSAGVVAFVSPFSAAEAKRGGTAAGPPIGALLDELAPGAVVDKQPDGSISVLGTLTPAVRAEVQRARALAEAGPNTIRCDGVGASLECVAVPDDQVMPALKAGEKGLYGRTVYRSITDEATGRGAPMFESGELVCHDARNRATLTCTRADRVQPVIGRGETLFVTYRPWNVNFDSQGVPVVRLGNPTVPLVRAAP